MLFDMLWFCALHFQILTNKACTIRVTKSFCRLLTWATDAKLFSWKEGCGSESSPGVRWHIGGSRAKHLGLRQDPFQC